MTPLVLGERDIVVVGPAGSKLRTVGFEVAVRLGRPFVDTDSLLVFHENRDAHEIIEESGLDELHRADAEMTKIALCASTAVVVAAPVSLFDLDVDELRLLLGDAWVVLLDVDAAAAEPANAGREKVATAGRDVIDEASGRDDHLLGQRRACALQVADIRIGVAGTTVDAVVDEVARAWSFEPRTAPDRR